ncbi:hypothetical protein HanXRQr2_Chr12g0553801 [Helianthus annuus]|uniref:Uncharacterized protein n=1 Tax=Helianthus annuus TaxID=4232 RepID=A0A9K3HIH4_HELAN|nr:hypothetical protein HanXRQr2_Chr12g0553801 [Helianthus annuus]KAJ0863705.1 hypothetical protein HanPSC8_Chr12g0533181 [Helianthus annuus]
MRYGGINAHLPATFPTNARKFTCHLHRFVSIFGMLKLLLRALLVHFMTYTLMSGSFTLLILFLEPSSPHLLI